jgi:hypothetical protein
VTVNPLTRLHLKSQNTKVIIDGFEWEVVDTMRLEDGRDYVLLATSTRQTTQTTHNQSYQFAADFYVSSIVGKQPTLADAVVIPKAETITTSGLNEWYYYPTGTLAIDHQDQIASFRLAVTHIKEISQSNNWKPGIGAPYWTLSHNITGHYIDANGNYATGINEAPNVGVRPFVWVQVPQEPAK